MKIEARIAELGLELPEAPRLPADVRGSFAWTRVHGDRIYIAGHSAQQPDGSPAGPFGKVPSEVSLGAATDAARQTALSVLASLRREIGDLDRISAWLMVQGMVNADSGFDRTPIAINGFSELILDLFGEERGRHARTAVGLAALPMNNAVVISAEIAFV